MEYTRAHVHGSHRDIYSRVSFVCVLLSLNGVGLEHTRLEVETEHRNLHDNCHVHRVNQDLHDHHGLHELSRASSFALGRPK